MQRLSWIIRMSLIVITSLSKRERRTNRKQRLERREEAPLLSWRAEEGDRELRNAGSLWKPVKERKQVLVLQLGQMNADPLIPWLGLPFREDEVSNTLRG